jgi:hypothetical protein
MWMYHFEPESKCRSMEWKPVTWPIKEKFKTQPSAGKVMLTLLIDYHVPTLEHCQDKDKTVNSVNYTDIQNITFCDQQK